jgi:light-regulated signal transduction histidine kinase (bacteriophytochrome)
LRFLLGHDCAVILLDVHMPGMDGIETAEMIRARERSRQTPIIFLTGSHMTQEMVFKGYSTGAVDYLLKPIVPAILLAKVEVFVELAIARQHLQAEIAERARIAAEISSLNAALAERNRDLIAANADLETFSYSVSHDLRAPLRHITAFITMIEESLGEKLQPNDRSRMNMVKDGARRMAQIIDDLLSFSKIGRAEMRKAPVDLNTLVREALSRIEPELANRRIDWTIRQLPEVRGDYNLLRQVLVNLVSNAVKYTRPRDPAKVEIESVPGNGEMIVAIRDNGVGFDMEYAGKLFGVFHRLHGENEFEGTGIGLANVRRIVQRHGGRVWAEGKVGHGAAFYFSIPAAP